MQILFIITVSIKTQVLKYISTFISYALVLLVIIYTYMLLLFFFGNPTKLIKLVYEIIINIICKNYYHLFNTVSIQ